MRTLEMFKNISDNDGLVLLRSLQDLDLCIELGPAAMEAYNVSGFLFPSLRPTGQHFLIHPMYASKLAEAVRFANFPSVPPRL